MTMKDYKETELQVKVTIKVYFQQIYSLLAAPSVILIIFSDKSRMSLR